MNFELHRFEFFVQPYDGIVLNHDDGVFAGNGLRCLGNGLRCLGNGLLCFGNARKGGVVGNKNCMGFILKIQCMSFESIRLIFEKNFRIFSAPSGEGLQPSRTASV